METTYATVIEDEIWIINGTKCSIEYCSEYGCVFPDCVTFSGEKFPSEEDARKKYNNLDIV